MVLFGITVIILGGVTLPRNIKYNHPNTSSRLKFIPFPNDTNILCSNYNNGNQYLTKKKRRGL